jgi:GTP cyclohydrolase FolE2
MIDVQSSGVSSRFAIASVGVTGLRYPLIARDAATGEEQPTVARWQLGVTLAAGVRGTHMSRFVTAVDALGGTPLDLDGHYRFAVEATQLLGATAAQIQAEFTWFRRIAAPVSGRAAQLESTVTFLSETGARPRKSLMIKVAAKALCPCSKAISDRGAHNQRSDLLLRLDFAPHTAVPSIASLLGLLESSASSPVYPLLKREDEKYVTESAYDNPVFVEDIVRGAAEKVADLPGIEGFTVEAINRESIHAYDCYARVVYP